MKLLKNEMTINMVEIIERAVSVLEGVKEEKENEKLKKNIIKKSRAEEEKKKQEGWRYVNITPTFRIFVPCDKNGFPTIQGKQMIEKRKKMLCL